MEKSSKTVVVHVHHSKTWERWHAWGRWLLTALIILTVIIIAVLLSIKYINPSILYGSSGSGSSGSGSSGSGSIPPHGSGINKSTAAAAVSGGTAKSGASSLLKDAQYGMMGYQAYQGGKYAYNYMYGSGANVSGAKEDVNEKDPNASEEASDAKDTAASSEEAASAEATAEADDISPTSVKSSASADAETTEAAVADGAETTEEAAAGAEETGMGIMDMFPELAEFWEALMEAPELIEFAPEIMDFTLVAPEIMIPLEIVALGIALIMFMSNSNSN
jgi:hypothetical protein